MEKESVNSADFDDDLKSLDDILGDLEQELIADFFYTWRWLLSSQDLSYRVFFLTGPPLKS